jgi:hypothetical protein
MAEEFKGINQETLKNVELLKGSMKEIAESTRNLNKQFKDYNLLLQDSSSNYGSIVSSASKFAELQTKVSKSASTTSKAFGEQQKQLSNIRSLNSQIENLMDQMVNSTKEEEKLLLRQAQNIASARDNAKELANAYGELAENSADLDKSTIWFSSIAEVVKDIPGLRKISGPFEAASKAARETVISNAKIKSINENISSLGKEALKTGKGLTKEKLKELGLSEQVGNLTGSSAASALKSYQANNKTTSVGIAGMQAGFKALGPVISKVIAPLALIKGLIEGIKFFVGAMFEADKRITNISRNLSLSKESSSALYKNIISTKSSLDDIRFTTTNLTEAFNEISQLSEFTTIANKDQLKTQVELTKFLGLQVEDALQLQELFAVNNIESEKGVDIAYDQIAAFANQNKIIANGKKIFSEIAKTSSIIKINFKGNTPELVKATLEAKKLGLSLDQVNKIAGSLLNFEDSISAELEAELLLGKDINLEEARRLALNNDIAGVTKEIAKQGITSEKFSRMNRIQQESIAKTLGMGADELADSLYRQEMIKNTAGKVTEQLREQAKEAYKRKDYEESIRLEKEAAAIEQGIVDGRSLEEAQKRASAEEKFNVALERAKEIFTDMVQPGGILDKITGILESIFGVKEQRSKKQLEEAGYTVQEGSGLFGTGAFKRTQLFKDGKAIEGSIGSGGVEALAEKYLKSKELKLLEGKSLENIDKNAYNRTMGIGPKFAEGGIVTKPITNATVGEAGPEAIIPLDQLMKRFDQMNNTLNAILNKEGGVYLDGTKVGTAMAVSTYRVQ